MNAHLSDTIGSRSGFGTVRVKEYGEDGRISLIVSKPIATPMPWHKRDAGIECDLHVQLLSVFSLRRGSTRLKLCAFEAQMS
jgi:hypothetical protein